MPRVHKLPSEFRRFGKIGGVIDFGLFDSDGGDDDIIAAIGTMLRRYRDFDEAALRTSGGRAIDMQAFMGDWYDTGSASLIRQGVWNTVDGRQLQDPPLRALDRGTIIGGGGAVPDPCSGGQFAFAFTEPPYSLKAAPREVQELFDAICEIILPPGKTHEIRDWSSPTLPQVSRYFDAGMDWWGVFLFSIYVPELRQLTIAMASTTD